MLNFLPSTIQREEQWLKRQDAERMKLVASN
jgi:hypothetical protein